MTKANLFIALGTLLIAAGGILATYGWNIRSTADTQAVLNSERAAAVLSQRQAMFRTLAAEITLNAEVLMNKAFHETNESELTKFIILPRLQLAALESAIASGLFATASDTKLYSTIVRLLHYTQDFNNRIAEYQTLMTRGDVKQLRIKLRDSDMISQQMSLMVTLGEALQTQGVDLDQHYLQAVKWLKK